MEEEEEDDELAPHEVLESSSEDDGQVAVDDVGATVAVYSAPRPGRKLHRNAIHHHFEAERDGKRKCLHCSRPVSNSATVMKRHLKTFHPEQYALFEDQQKNLATKTKKGKTDSSLRQTTINFKRTNLFPYNSARKRQIDAALGLVAAMPTCSLNFLLNDRVRNLMNCMESQYEWPASSSKLLTLIDAPFSRLKSNLLKLLKSAPKIALSADVWSQQGMARSYIAVTAHLYSESTKMLEHCLLSIEPLTGRHTAQLLKSVCDRVLIDYQLNEDAISFYVTDNGSNVIKAFRQSQLLICTELEAEEDAQMQEVRPAEQAAYFADRNIEEEAADESDEESYAQVDSGADFDEAVDQEESFDLNKRIECIAHTLMLVLHKVTTSVFKSSTAISQLLALLRRFRKSVRATELLIGKCGRTVLLPAKTRWNSMFIVLDRVLAIKDSINQCCVELDLPSLGGSINELTALRDLLEPFYRETNFLQAENYSTISSVYPLLKKLLFDLESNESVTKFACLGTLRSDLVNELKQRFQFVLDISSNKFHPVYLVSTLLDPTTAWIVEDELHDSLQRQMAAMVRQFALTNDEPAANLVETPTSSAASGSRFGAFGLQMKAAKRQRIEYMQETIDAVIRRYFNRVTAAPPDQEEMDPFEFWRSNFDEFGPLAALAKCLLPIPATSAPVERVFSQAGIATCNRRNRTGASLLIKKLMLEMNKKYL